MKEILLLSLFGVLVLGNFQNEEDNEIGTVKLNEEEKACLGKLARRGPLAYRLCLWRQGQITKTGQRQDDEVSQQL